MSTQKDTDFNNGRDSQVGEPVGHIMIDTGVFEHGTKEYHLDGNWEPVYTTPPPAQINQQLAALLEKSLHWLDGLCDAGPLGQQYPSDELTQFVEDIRAALAATQMRGDA